MISPFAPPFCAPRLSMKLPATIFTLLLLPAIPAPGDTAVEDFNNYGSADIATIKGVHSRKIAGLLGYDYGSEVVHRNNLVVL